MQNQLLLPTAQEILFENRAEKISLATLRKTLVDSPLRRTEFTTDAHYDFLTWILQKLEDKVGDKAKMDYIWISSSHAKRIDNVRISKKEPCPVEKLFITRLCTTIYVDEEKNVVHDNVGRERFRFAIGVAYDIDKGITITSGTNVWSCSNMCVFGSRRWSTKGTNRVTYTKLKEIVLEEINQHSNTLEEDIETIKAFMDKPLNRGTEQRIMARLLEVAVDSNARTNMTGEPLVLNLSQVSSMQEELIKKRRSGRDLAFWDMLQAGTEALKADRQDQVSLLPTIANFNSYMEDKLSRMDEVGHVPLENFSA